MQVPCVHQEISIQPSDASVSEGMGKTVFIACIWSKRRHSPELGKADRLVSLQGTMCCSCQNPPGKMVPGDLPSSLAHPRPREVPGGGLVTGPNPPKQWRLISSLQSPLWWTQQMRWVALWFVFKSAPHCPRWSSWPKHLQMIPLRTVFPDSVCNTPTHKTGDAAFGGTAASLHHAPSNLLKGRKVSNLSTKLLVADLNKYLLFFSFQSFF